MIRVGVFGAGGRMGGEVCRTVAAEGDLSLVAAVDPAFAGRPVDEVAGVAGSELVVAAEPEALRAGGAEVAVDFTVASSAFRNIRWCVENRVHAVVGTTGLTPEQTSEIARLAEGAAGNVFIAPNFAIGAVLMMEFARKAAAWLPDAEIIELHHATKKDAPSGTALRTLEGIVEGRRARAGEAESAETLPGVRGGEKDGVRIHSIRLPGLVAHQEVIFGGQGQTLSIRHDSTDRTSFMPGVLLAIKEVARRPGLTVGLENLLGP